MSCIKYIYLHSILLTPVVLLLLFLLNLNSWLPFQSLWYSLKEVTFMFNILE